MRKEATIGQWKELYEVATRIKEMKPWDKFWDLDIIGIREETKKTQRFTVYWDMVGTVMGLLYMKDMKD